MTGIALPQPFNGLGAAATDTVLDAWYKRASVQEEGDGASRSVSGVVHARRACSFGISCTVFPKQPCLRAINTWVARYTPCLKRRA
jgi:hypothetical protein